MHWGRMRSGKFTRLAHCCHAVDSSALAGERQPCSMPTGNGGTPSAMLPCCGRPVMGWRSESNAPLQAGMLQGHGLTLRLVTLNGRLSLPARPQSQLAAACVCN